MSYAQFPRKYLGRPIINPDHFGQARKAGAAALPKGCILYYREAITQHLTRRFKDQAERIRAYTLWGAKAFYTDRFCFAEMKGVGAPHAAAMLEELIALGLNEFINIGTAGGLTTSGFFLCEKALRDDGTSIHYLPHEEYCYPDAALTQALGAAFREQNVAYTLAPSWTTAALYRETDLEAAQYRAAGIATVEMEAAGLFAVAQFRGVKLASAFVTSDLLSDDWRYLHHEDPKRARQDLIQLADIAVHCLTSR